MSERGGGESHAAAGSASHVAAARGFAEKARTPREGGGGGQGGVGGERVYMTGGSHH